MISTSPLNHTAATLDSRLPASSYLLKLLLLLSAGLLIVKLALALILDLYSDEIFYWLASTRLAPAYSDLPFMTSLLVWLGTSLEPGNTGAIRSLFLLLGSSLPLLVYWLAVPITSHKQALASALLALCVPLGGFLGLLAVPDVPIIFFGLLSAGLFERGLRTNAMRYWLLLGACVALGMSTHYRFVLYPAAAVLFLLLHAPSRSTWRNPRFLMALGIACLGLLPVLWFNLSNQMASASFYLIERHPWEFRAQGLSHLFIQAGLITPPLYALFLFTLWRMAKLAREDKGVTGRSALMLLCLALMNLLVYLVLAPWTDPTSTTEHWPLSGYFPVLVYMPSALIALSDWLSTKMNAQTARRLSLGIPTLGFIGTLVGLMGVGTQAFQEPLQSIVGRGVLSNKMAGWREFTAHTSELLTANFRDEKTLIVTDNYYTAAQLAFAGLVEEPRTIDIDKAARDGRSLQLRLWNMDSQSLGNEGGREVLLITEDSELNILEGIEVVDRMCDMTRNMEHFDRLSLFNGDKQFTYYTASLTAASEANEASPDADPCPYPPRAWLEPPIAGQVLSGSFHIEGWAFKEDIGIRSVSLLLNGEEVANMHYGIARPDVVDAIGVASDPNAPNLGYAYELDTTQFTNGNYTIAIKLLDERGVTDLYGERVIEIRN